MDTKVQSGRVLRWFSGIFGSRILDQETGELLGKAFFVPFKGEVLIVGYTGTLPLRPVVKPTRRLDYWRQSVGFSGPKEPDFPKLK